MIFGLMFSFLSLALEPRGSVLTERIEARVGSQIITSTDLAYRQEAIRRGLSEPKNDREVRSFALEALIEQALVREYLSRTQLSVSDQDVERRLNSIRQSSGAVDMAEFSKMLEAQGLTLDRFRAQVREQIEAQEFFGILKRQTIQTVGEKELKSFYQNNLDRFQNDIEIELQECLIPFSNNEAEVRKVAASFEKKKSPFSQCVEKYSRSPSASSGGKLGSVRRGVMREEIDALVFSAKKGEVVIVELPGALQLLYLTSRKDLGLRKLEEAKPEIERAIEQERLVNARDRMLQELRSNTFVKVSS